MPNPEIEVLQREIDDHTYFAAKYRGEERVYKDRIVHLEGMIRDKRRRIEEIENESG